MGCWLTLLTPAWKRLPLGKSHEHHCIVPLHKGNIQISEPILELDTQARTPTVVTLTQLDVHPLGWLGKVNLPTWISVPFGVQIKGKIFSLLIIFV